MEGAIGVVIVDDHPVFRQSLRRIIEREPGLAIVGEAGDGLSGVRMVERHRPHIVLMDISMPVMNGIEATRIITSRFPETRVIILSMHAGEAAGESCRTGACEHLSKGCSVREILSAIRAA